MVTRAFQALAARRNELSKNEKGFTLIELLVVVIIIGILAAIAIPIFLGQQAQAKGAAVESAIANAKIDVVSSITTTGKFPDDAALTAIWGKAKEADANITLTGTGTLAGFCISGAHGEVASKTWAANDVSGVIEGATCEGAVLKKP